MTRRPIRLLIRWGLAVVLCAGTGVGTACAVTAADRTDLPGLRTASDGRWDYPRLTPAPLPSASPRFGHGTKQHAAALSALLLPHPAGAHVRKVAHPRTAFVDFFGTQFRSRLRTQLDQQTVRDVAAADRTMPDGTRSRIFLLRFPTAPLAQEFYDQCFGSGHEEPAVPASAPETHLDYGPDITGPDSVSMHTYVEPAPGGARRLRHTFVDAGDVLALVAQDRHGSVPRTPFVQTVELQAQLLG